MHFTNKRALVLGATKGIGKATAMGLAQKGVHITAVARSATGLEKLRTQLPGDGHRTVACDLSDSSTLDGLLDQLTNSDETTTIFINNCGGPPPGSLLDAQDEDFHKALQIHILSPQMILKTLVPQMKEFGQGRIINVISTSVKIPIPNLGVSNTLRSATASWSKTLANELGTNRITVNNVLPGYTETDRLLKRLEREAKNKATTTKQISQNWKDQVPLKRFATPEEIAHAIIFLTSDQASYINGINLPIDGGRLGSM